MAKILNVKGNYGTLGFTVVGSEDEDSGIMKYYARLVPYSKLSGNIIKKWAAEFCKVTEAQMNAGFLALRQAIEYFVLNGHSITLEGLGNITFSTQTGIWNSQTQKWGSAGKSSMDDVSPSDIKGVYVRFRPCTELREVLGSSKLQCIDDTTFGYQKVNNSMKQAASSGSGSGSGEGSGTGS